MSFIFGALLSVLQCLSLVGLYWLLALGLAAILPLYLPGYDEFNALNDVQMVLIIVLLFDRFYGPYGRLLRDVAKTLKKAKRKRE